MVVVGRISVTDTHNQVTALSTACRKGNGIVITRDDLHRTAQIDIPRVAGKLNIGAKDTIRDIQGVTRPSSLAIKTTVFEELDRRRGGVSTRISISISISSSRVCHRRPRQISVTDMAHEDTHVIDVYLPKIGAHIKQHPAWPGEGDTPGAVRGVQVEGIALPPVF